VPKIKYVDVAISADRLGVIKTANKIIAEYQAQGFDLTLRQLYYQFVSRDLIPNRQSEYKRLGDIINDGRLAGLIDWNAIVDRTRNLRSLSHWTDPAQLVEACAEQFRVDRWATQPNRVEVWIEKDALVGVIPFFSCRGYTSQSEMWSAAMRLKRYHQAGQVPIILHFGDHDPSGMDMTRDITDRLSLFMGRDMDVQRLALNQDQVERYSPPPNPAKITDSRAKAYIAQFGDESWELDALEPAVLAALIRDTLDTLIDKEAWDAKLEEQTDGRSRLKAVSENWEDIQERL
jgi:hypothetical protein